MEQYKYVVYLTFWHEENSQPYEFPHSLNGKVPASLGDVNATLIFFYFRLSERNIV